jgi:hypothetical protein
MATGQNDNGELNIGEGDLSKQEVSEFIAAFEELERDFKDMAARLNPLLEKRLQELAGTQLQTMLSAQGETMKYLADPNPKLREAALKIAYRHWKITDKLAAVYETMAFADPDNQVRETAIRALGTCYARTKDRRIGHLLASVVRDRKAEASMRITAFVSLLRLHRNLDYKGKSPLVPVSLDEVDWDFVESYYKGHAERGEDEMETV